MTKLQNLFWIMALTFMWSPSFLFIKLALESFAPLTIVTLRVSFAAIIFMGIICIKRIKLPKDWRYWFSSFIMALFSSIIPFSLFCYAEQSIDSALAALINGTTPMFTAILAHYFVFSDKVDRQKLLGISLSIFGLILLFTPQLKEGITGTALGMSAALLASLSYGVSHVFGKLNLSNQEPFVVPASQLIISSVLLWPFAIYHDEIWLLNMPSGLAILGICGLSLFGTVFAFIIYYKLLAHCGPTAISTVACFFPVGGMLLGYIFLKEGFSWLSMFAALMILLGILIVNKVIFFIPSLIRKTKEA